MHDVAGSTLEDAGSFLISWEGETWWSQGYVRCIRDQGVEEQRDQHSPQGGMQAGADGEEAALDWGSL